MHLAALTRKKKIAQCGQTIDRLIHKQTMLPGAVECPACLGKIQGLPEPGEGAAGGHRGLQQTRGSKLLTSSALFAGNRRSFRRRSMIINGADRARA